MLHVKYCLKPIQVFIGFKLNFKGFFLYFPFILHRDGTQPLSLRPTVSDKDTYI